jgi:hypothetical protein
VHKTITTIIPFNLLTSGNDAAYQDNLCNNRKCHEFVLNLTGEGNIGTTGRDVAGVGIGMWSVEGITEIQAKSELEHGQFYRLGDARAAVWRAKGR